jgi:uncharacterized LabA/DUF88 family protein
VGLKSPAAVMPGMDERWALAAEVREPQSPKNEPYGDASHSIFTRTKRTAMKAQKNAEKSRVSRVLVLVDESNVISSAWSSNRSMEWIKLRDFFADEKRGRELIEMVVYVGLPPAMPAWQTERDKKSKFVHWLRTNGFLAVTKDGSPAEEGHYKSNVDVMMAIDAVELSTAMQPDVVILVTGDADFAYLALQLRRRGIRVEVASVSANLGSGLKSAANEVIDLAPLLATFEPMKGREK